MTEAPTGFGGFGPGGGAYVRSPRSASQTHSHTMILTQRPTTIVIQKQPIVLRCLQ